MNKTFIVIFIFCNLRFANAETIQKIIPTKEIPAELALMIQYIQSKPHDEKIFLDQILKIDSYAKTLSKEEFFLTTKIQIYKSLLQNVARNSKAQINIGTESALKEIIQKISDPFLKWFFTALLQDTKNILSQKNYSEYLLARNSGNLEKKDYKKIEKKIQLIYRWTSAINSSSDESISILAQELLSLANIAIRDVEQALYLLTNIAGNRSSFKVTSDPKDLQFFHLAQEEIKKKSVREEKSIDDILAPVIDKDKFIESTLPKPSAENWLEEEETPNGLKNLPKPSDDANWLEDI